jgi:hypothetical protein
MSGDNIFLTLVAIAAGCLIFAIMAGIAELLMIIDMRREAAKAQQKDESK